KVGSKQVTGTVASISYAVNVNTLDRQAAEKFALNEIGMCRLKLDRPIPVDTYGDSRETGGFILIDRVTNGTVGAGLIQRALPRSRDVHWQSVDIDKGARSSLKGQKAAVLWFTGLSGAGKSTIA